MSLSAHLGAPVGSVPPIGDDWGDSPYGSLITRGPRSFKKKPVLMLDPEELAKAHIAIALGGAEIMETQPDPVAAPRPRQPATLLGLAPIGAEFDDEPTPAPAAFDDGWDEPEPVEAEPQTWEPEAEDEDEDDFLPAEPALEATSPEAQQRAHFNAMMQTPAAEPESVFPSIESQLRKNRERLAARTAAAAPPVAEPAPPAALHNPLERLEIDDWAQHGSLKGFIPPPERDRPAPPPQQPELLPPVQAREPAPPPAPVATVVPEPAPEPVTVAPVAPVAPAPRPAPEPVADLVPEPEPAPIAQAMPKSVPEPVVEEEIPAWLDLGEDDEWAEEAAAEPLAARIAAGHANTLRVWLVDHTEAFVREPDPAPSLFARLWSWLRGRGF